MEENEYSRLQSSDSRAGRTALEHAQSTNRWLLALLVFSLTAVVVLAVLMTSHARKKESSDVCYSSECIHTASRLLRDMEPGADPCSSLYALACGGWLRGASTLGAVTSRFTAFNDAIASRLLEILMEPVNASQPAHAQKTKAFFMSCLNTTEREALGGEPLRADLEALGGWPVLDERWLPDGTGSDWIQVLSGLRRKGYPSDMLLGLYVTTDQKNESRTLLTVQQPSLGMGNKGHYERNESLAAYEAFLYKVAALLRPRAIVDDQERVSKQLREAMRIESRLAKHSLSDAERKVLYFRPQLLTLDNLEAAYPHIPWRRWIAEWLPEGVAIDGGEELSVPDVGIVKEMDAILQEIKTTNSWRSLQNYLLYRAAADGAPYLSREYERAHDDFRSALGRDSSSRPESASACVDETKSMFHFSLESSYARKYFEISNREKIQILLDDVKKSLEAEIQRVDWMDPKTRQRALRKAREIRSAIGFPNEILNDTILDDYFKDITIDENYYSNAKAATYVFDRKNMEQLHKFRHRFSWEDNVSLLVANAYYRAADNAIIIPEGLLQEEVFAAGRPSSLEYGYLGGALGHELVHAFDGLGSMFDENGNFAMWWENASYAQFQKRAQCFVDQYDSIYDPDVNLKVNGTLTLPENLADNGGLRAAYMGYRRWKRRNGGEKRLPGLPYTQDQMFWIGYASLWCRRQSKKYKIEVMKTNEHPPPEFRVNGAASNMPEYSIDFQCRAGSPMNPPHKCSLWS